MIPFGAALTFLALAAPAAEEDARPPADSGLVERVEVSLVRVDLRAADRRGRPVTDLRADEIVVREGDQALEVAYLEAVAPPSAGPSSATVTLTVPDGALAMEATAGGSGTVLALFDLLNTTPTTRERTRRDLAAYLRERAPRDLRIGLATAEADFRLRVPPTLDRQAVLTALANDATFHRPPDDPLPGLFRDMQIQRMTLPGVDGESAASFGTARCETLSLATLESMRTAVDLLAPLEGTKEILFVSEGFPMACPNATLVKEELFDQTTPYRDSEPNDLRYRFPVRKKQVRFRVDPKVPFSGIRGTFDRLLDAAARARVAFLTIHPKAVGRFRVGSSEIAQFQSPSLNALSAHTGGEHFAGSSIRRSLERAQSSRAGAYELGFYRAGGAEGLPRELRIRTTRGKVRLFHRRARGTGVPAALREPGALRFGRARPDADPPAGRVAWTIPVEVDTSSFRFLPTMSGALRARFSLGLTLSADGSGPGHAALYVITVDDSAIGTRLLYEARVEGEPGGYLLRGHLSEPDGGALDRDERALEPARVRGQAGPTPGGG